VFRVNQVVERIDNGRRVVIAREPIPFGDGLRYRAIDCETGRIIFVLGSEVRHLQVDDRMVRPDSLTNREG